MKRIYIFFALIMSVGVAARWYDGIELNVLSSTFGQLGWLIALLVIAIAFHLFGKQKSNWGLKPKLPSSWRWYIFALLFYPIITIILIGLGNVIGGIEPTGQYNLSYISLAILMSIPSYFVKNIFEEFVWRGFLFSRLEKENIFGLKNHLIVGLIWGCWHLPYLDTFANVYHDLSPFVYVPLFLVGVMATSVIYGELRRRSGTVWTAVILHTIANAVVNTLFYENYVQLNKGWEWVISPTIDNFGYIALVSVFAILLLQKKSRAKEGNSKLSWF